METQKKFESFRDVKTCFFHPVNRLAELFEQFTKKKTNGDWGGFDKIMEDINMYRKLVKDENPRDRKKRMRREKDDPDHIDIVSTAKETVEYFDKMKMDFESILNKEVMQQVFEKHEEFAWLQELKNEIHRLIPEYKKTILFLKEELEKDNSYGKKLEIEQYIKKFLDISFFITSSEIDDDNVADSSPESKRIMETYLKAFARNNFNSIKKKKPSDRLCIFTNFKAEEFLMGKVLKDVNLTEEFKKISTYFAPFDSFSQIDRFSNLFYVNLEKSDRKDVSLSFSFKKENIQKEYHVKSPSYFACLFYFADVLTIKIPNFEHEKITLFFTNEKDKIPFDLCCKHIVWMTARSHFSKTEWLQVPGVSTVSTNIVYVFPNNDRYTEEVVDKIRIEGYYAFNNHSTNYRCFDYNQPVQLPDKTLKSLREMNINEFVTFFSPPCKDEEEEEEEEI